MADIFDNNNTDQKNQPIRLAEKYAYSEKFRELFSQGMTLVEESAGFLDGRGREAVKILDREASVLYGSQSMQLTTRLMQLASWLLLQRAANEGEMNHSQVLEEKEKINLAKLPTIDASMKLDALPEEFIELVEQSLKLQERIVHLDSELYGNQNGAIDDGANPVSQQIELLSTALGVKKFG